MIEYQCTCGKWNWTFGLGSKVCHDCTAVVVVERGTCDICNVVVRARKWKPLKCEDCNNGTMSKVSKAAQFYPKG